MVASVTWIHVVYGVVSEPRKNQDGIVGQVWRYSIGDCIRLLYLKEDQMHHNNATPDGGITMH